MVAGALFVSPGPEAPISIGHHFTCNTVNTHALTHTQHSEHTPRRRQWCQFSGLVVIFSFFSDHPGDLISEKRPATILEVFCRQLGRNVLRVAKDKTHFFSPRSLQCLCLPVCLLLLLDWGKSSPSARVETTTTRADTAVGCTQIIIIRPTD